MGFVVPGVPGSGPKSPAVHRFDRDRLKADLLGLFKRVGKLDLDIVIIDGVTVRDFGGGEAAGPTPVDRGRPGAKHAVMGDKAGVPLEIRERPGCVPTGTGGGNEDRMDRRLLGSFSIPSRSFGPSHVIP